MARTGFATLPAFAARPKLTALARFTPVRGTATIALSARVAGTAFAGAFAAAFAIARLRRGTFTTRSLYGRPAFAGSRARAAAAIAAPAPPAARRLPGIAGLARLGTLARGPIALRHARCRLFGATGAIVAIAALCVAAVFGGPLGAPRFVIPTALVSPGIGWRNRRPLGSDGLDSGGFAVGLSRFALRLGQRQRSTAGRRQPRG